MPQDDSIKERCNECIDTAMKMYKAEIDIGLNDETDFEPHELAFIHLVVVLSLIKGQMCHPEAHAYKHKPEDFIHAAQRCFISAFRAVEKVDFFNPSLN